MRTGAVPKPKLPDSFWPAFPNLTKLKELNFFVCGSTLVIPHLTIRPVLRQLSKFSLSGYRGRTEFILRGLGPATMLLIDRCRLQLHHFNWCLAPDQSVPPEKRPPPEEQLKNSVRSLTVGWFREPNGSGIPWSDTFKRIGQHLKGLTLLDVLTYCRVSHHTPCV